MAMQSKPEKQIPIHKYDDKGNKIEYAKYEPAIFLFISYEKLILKRKYN